MDERRLRARISSDGRSSAHKDVVIDEDGHLLLTLALGGRARWTVERAGADGVVRSEVLPGIPAREVPRGSSPGRPNLEQIPVEVSGEIFYLHQTGFQDSDRRSRDFADDLAVIAARSGAVILDLRGNGGGRTRSLLDEWAVSPSGRSRRTPRAGPASRSSGGRPIRTSRACSGVVVGGETASGRWMQNCERYATFELPESGLAVRVPLESLATADVAGRGHGVIPDVPVAPTILDLAEGRDPVYERGLELARERIGTAPE